MSEPLIAGSIAAVATVLALVAVKVVSRRRRRVPQLHPGVLSTLELPWRLAKIAPPEYCREKCLVPIATDDATVTVAVAARLATDTREELVALSGRHVVTVLAPPEEILTRISDLFAELDRMQPEVWEPESVADVLELLEDLDAQADGSEPPVNGLRTHRLMVAREQASADAFLSLVLVDAIERVADAVYLVPTADSLHVYFRIDGEHLEIRRSPRELHAALADAAWDMTGADPPEGGVAPDAWVVVESDDLPPVYCRVSVWSTRHGRQITILRLLPVPLLH